MTMQNRYHTVVAGFFLATTVICLGASPGRLHALEMGPALFMVQDVPPGQEVNLHTLGGVVFTVVNDSDQEQSYALVCRRPSQAGVVEWEKGYEEIPDPAWCKLEEASFTVPARGEKKTGLVINIPDKPENYNRKFVLAVMLSAVSSDQAAAFGVGLAVTARVEIETTVDPRPATGGGPIGTVPGALTVTGNPGAAVTGTVQLRNNTGRWLKAMIERLPEVYADPEKQMRYFSHGFTAQTGAPWLVPKTPAFALKVGETSTLEFAGTIPATATPGQKYEELAFVRIRTDEGKESRALVRLRFQVTEPGPKPETPPAPAPPGGVRKAP
jgi:hypothetical protein